MAEKWMQHVSSGIKHRGTEGSFRNAAHRAGMSTLAYARKKKHAGGTIGKRANLALNYMKAKHGG